MSAKASVSSRHPAASEAASSAAVGVAFATLAASNMEAHAFLRAQEEPADAIPSPSVSPQLEGLIEAKHAAYGAFNEVLGESYKIEKAYFAQHRKELFVELSIGGAQSFHPDFDRDFMHEDVRADIVRRYEGERRKLAAIEKLDPAVAANAMAALRAGQAKDLRTFRQVLRDEIGCRKTFGYWQAKETEDQASTADMDTFTALCAYRCTNSAELARKSEVLAYYTGPRFAEISTDDFQILLASMMPETREAAGLLNG